MKQIYIAPAITDIKYDMVSIMEGSGQGRYSDLGGGTNPNVQEGEGTGENGRQEGTNRSKNAWSSWDDEDF